jgi:histone deacetylase 1/2
MNLQDSLDDVKWKGSTDEEYRALMKNKSWHLVPKKYGTNVIYCTWVFRVKRKA